MSGKKLSTIKVLNVAFNVTNIRQYLTKISYRWYRLEKEIMITIETNQGTFRYFIDKGFCFDSRSGGFGIDWVLPHLGTDHDIVTWILHDVNAYGKFFDFADTNEIMRQMLIHGGNSEWRANAGHWGVSLSKSWFGEPKPYEREWCNVYPEIKFRRVQIYV